MNKDFAKAKYEPEPVPLPERLRRKQKQWKFDILQVSKESCTLSVAMYVMLRQNAAHRTHDII
jgi:hypothetical protein